MNPLTKDRGAPRALETLAMLMIGDGVLGLVGPERHTDLWLDGPRPWRAMIEPFARRPLLTRGFGAAMVLAGLWLARRQRA